jgi:HK97 family phage major capsid protein
MDANTIIFGDLKTYKARIARDFSVSVLKEALMEYLAVGVMGFGRADGKLVNAGTDPVAILK